MRSHLVTTAATIAAILPALTQVSLPADAAPHHGPTSRPTAHKPSHAMIKRQQFNRTLNVRRNPVALPNFPTSSNFPTNHPHHIFPTLPGTGARPVDTKIGTNVPHANLDPRPVTGTGKGPMGKRSGANSEPIGTGKGPMGKRSGANPGPVGTGMGPMGKRGIPPSDPLAGQTRAQLRAKIDDARQARDLAAAARAGGRPPATIAALDAQADAKQTEANAARAELAKRASAAPQPPPSTSPSAPPSTGPQGPSSPERPGRVIVPIPMPVPYPAQSPSDPSGGGNPNGRPFPVGPVPPGVPPSNPPTAQPNTTAQNEPKCISGTWETEGRQRQYVCRSWFYLGRLYTPEQLMQVLGQQR